MDHIQKGPDGLRRADVPLFGLRILHFTSGSARSPAEKQEEAEYTEKHPGRLESRHGKPRDFHFRTRRHLFRIHRSRDSDSDHHLCKVHTGLHPDGIECAASRAALGMGIGCYLAGLLSGNKIELGLVPFGGLGIALFLPLAGYFPGSAVPVIERFGLVLHLWALLYLLLAGIAGGLFIVPFRAYFQQRVSPQSRGAALAFSNVLTFGGVLISSAVVFLLIAGAATNVPGLPAWVDALVRHMPSFAPPTLFLALSLMTLVFLFAIMRLMPDFLVRSFIFLLTHTLYRLKVTGEERIPDHGPALLVSNHASFVDGFMISACTSRRIRFLMHEDYYQIPLLNPFARFAGFIEVPRLNRIKSMSNMIGNVKDALRQGDIVCVFPEGKITRNGIMDEFRGGFKAMLPDDVHVPVIPVRIGMIWGSIFSYYYGRLKLRFPKELPHPVTISFGKPVPHGITAYELRQTISELAADTDMTPPVPRNAPCTIRSPDMRS